MFSLHKTKERQTEDDDPYSLSDAEIKKLQVLICESDARERTMIRSALKGAGVQVISEAQKMSQALDKLRERHFTHLFFGVGRGEIPDIAFMKNVLIHDQEVSVVAISSQADVETVFELLKAGARGFVLKPYNSDSMRYTLALSRKGEPIPDILLYAKNRNEVFASITAASLDKLVEGYRQCRELKVKKPLTKLRSDLLEIVRLGKTFSRGGAQEYALAIERMFIELSKGPSTILGRLRKRLSDGRGEESEEEGKGKSGNFPFL